MIGSPGLCLASPSLNDHSSSVILSNKNDVLCSAPWAQLSIPAITQLRFLETAIVIWDSAKDLRAYFLFCHTEY